MLEIALSPPHLPGQLHAGDSWVREGQHNGKERVDVTVTFAAVGGKQQRSKVTNDREEVTH